MAERKIPNFLSKEFHKRSSKEEKNKLLEQYDIWIRQDITKWYILFLESKLDSLIEEDEQKTDWLSVFHWKYKRAHNKGQRNLLRFLLKVFK